MGEKDGQFPPWNRAAVDRMTTYRDANDRTRSPLNFAENDELLGGCSTARFTLKGVVAQSQHISCNRTYVNFEFAKKL